MIDLRTAAQNLIDLQDMDHVEINKAFNHHDDWLIACRVARNALRSALAQEPDIGPEWKPCVKLPITVHVRDQRPGETHVSTREGITPVKPDDLIMRGVSGEEYPIGREIFEKTYRLGSALAEPTIRNHRTVEPVGYCTLEQLVTLKRMVPSDNTIALYTAPSRREPLTGEEIAFLVARHSEFKTHFIGDEVFATTQCDGVALARAIERAHRIKGEE